MSARRVRFALAVAAVLLLLVPALSAQNSHARIVRLSYMDGQVQVTRNSGQTDKALLNMPIVEGMKLSVEQGGHAEVEFENDSTMRLVGPAQVSFRELTLDPDGKRDTLIAVSDGLVYFDLPRAKDNEFQVEFNGHTFAAKKSSQFRVDVSGDEQNLAVTKGELVLQGGPTEVTVKKNETISFQGNAQYALNKGVDPLGADTWNKDREQDRQLLARSEQYHASNSYYGNAYGAYDLARYGNWFYGPGYGWMWRPYFYDASYAYDPMAWDPFGNGNWSYYPGFGWTFISGYPWGWAPYRYGSWMFVPGFGWSWRPGPPSYAWQTVPVVVNPPSGFAIPRPPNKNVQVMPGTTIAARPSTGVGLMGGVPRPGQTVMTREIVPMHRVVPPGALNAGKVGQVRAIGIPGGPQGTMIRPNAKGMETGNTATMPNSKLPNTQPHATPPPAQPRMTPQPRPEPHMSAPREPSMRSEPPMMHMPSGPPPSTPHSSGGSKPH
jgi:Family of unknown function (DUF6600)/FecR protein